MTDAPPAPTTTVDAAELDRLRKVIQKVWRDPEIGAAVRKHAKDVVPDLPLPEDDLEPVLAPLRNENKKLADSLEKISKLLEKRDEDDAKKVTERRDADYAAMIEEAAKRFSLTGEGRDKMIERLREFPSTDPMAAAAYVVSQNPPPPPPGPLYGSNVLNFAGSSDPGTDDLYKLLHSGPMGPEKYLEAHIQKAWDPRTSKEYVASVMGKTYADLAFAE